MLETPDGILIPRAKIEGWCIWAWSNRLPSVVEFFVGDGTIKITVTREHFDDLADWVALLRKYGLPDEELMGAAPRDNGHSPFLDAFIEEALNDEP